MANFPYGVALSSFLDAFNQAEQRALQGRQGELREALALRQLTEADRAKREEEQVFEDLAREIAGRRATPLTPAGIQVIPGAMPAGEGMGAEAALAGATAGPPMSTAGLMPTPTPRPPFGASLPPERAARVLASPKAQRVIQSVEESEKEQERQQHREEAQKLFGVATERFRGKDGAGGYEELAKAYHRLGLHGEGGKAFEHAITLRTDKDEADLFEQDLGGWLTAQQTFQAAPSIKTHAEFLDSLTGAKSKTGRAFRGQLLGNQMKAALGKDPFSAIFFKKLNEHYSEAWAKGEKPDFETVLKRVDKEQPGLLLRVMGNELEANKDVHKAIFTRILGIGEEIDPAKLKDFTVPAAALFRRQFGRTPASSDDFSWIYKKAGELEGAKKQAEAQADPAKQELEQLKLEKERFERDIRGGKIEPNLNQLTLFRQRATAGAAKADDTGDTELAESYRTEERHWSQRIAEQIKKQPAGKEFGKPKAGTAAAILGGRTFDALPDEEKQGALLAEAKRLFPAKVKTFEDLKKLSRPERERLKAEIGKLEGAGGGQP